LQMDEQSYCYTAVRSHSELQHLAEHVSNNETRFFRDAEQFDSLQTQIIPQLMASRSRERRLNIWSAACSTGEEAYSLAILLHQALPEHEKWQVTIFATDLRGQAILAATRGRYPSSALSLIPPPLRDRYFTRADAGGREQAFDVVAEIKPLVAFRRANLYDAEFWKHLRQPFDLILCNNLLLYFHALAVKQTVARMAATLPPHGWLSVMKDESSYIDHVALRREPALRGSFFKKQ
jgi:chemotaxis protein methyltransferase CheR